jgi:hypothetical protein
MTGIISSLNLQRLCPGGQVRFRKQVRLVEYKNSALRGSFR